MPHSAIGASVKLNSISRQYIGSPPIFRDLSLEIKSGEFVSLLGPSGCGKSTLLRLIGALDQPNQGTLEFRTGLPVAENIQPTRGFVFQEPRLLPWRTVLGNVKLPLELNRFTPQTAHQRAVEAIERVGLADSILQFPAELSGGMKMRVSVARALVFQPTLLLLDEPFSSLDELTRHALQSDLRALWESLGMTVIFVTHLISEAVFLSNRVIVLSQRPCQIVSDQTIELPERTPLIRMDHRFSLEMQKIGKSLRREE